MSSHHSQTSPISITLDELDRHMRSIVPTGSDTVTAGLRDLIDQRAIPVATIVAWVHHYEDRPVYQAKLLIELGRQVRDPARHAVLGAALNTATTIPSNANRERVLTSLNNLLIELSQQVPDPARHTYLDMALDAIGAIQDTTRRTEALIALKGTLETQPTDPTVVHRALDLALGIPHPSSQGRSLAYLVGLAAPERQHAIIETVLEHIRASEPEDRYDLLCLLVKHTLPQYVDHVYAALQLVTDQPEGDTLRATFAVQATRGGFHDLAACVIDDIESAEIRATTLQAIAQTGQQIPEE